jgi:hypothetical protein
MLERSVGQLVGCCFEWSVVTLIPHRRDKSVRQSERDVVMPFEAERNEAGRRVMLPTRMDCFYLPAYMLSIR